MKKQHEQQIAITESSPEPLKLVGAVSLTELTPEQLALVSGGQNQRAAHRRGRGPGRSSN